MLIWILGEKEKEEERLGQAVAGAFVRGITLHGESVRKDFKIGTKEIDEKARLLLIYRLALTAKILVKQDCLVVVAHDEDMRLVEAVRKMVDRSLLVLIDKTPTKKIKPPYMVWRRTDSIHDRDEMVEEILRTIKKEV